MSKELAQPIKFKRKKIPIEIKKQIIEKREKGVSVVDLAREYNRNTSTICSILKAKEKLKVATVSKGVSRRSDKRSQVIDDVERRLLIWINEQRVQGENVTQPIICEKAKRIFCDLVETMPSNGWFERFKQRTGIHKVNVEVNIEPNHIKELLAVSAGAERTELQMVSVGTETPNPPSNMENIRQVLQAWDTVCSYVLQHHPDKAMALRACAMYETNAIAHFRSILIPRQKQST